MSSDGEVRRKGTGRNEGVDPTGQIYLPGYFCPAALFHSREITQDMGRVGQKQQIIVPQIQQERIGLKCITTATTIKMTGTVTKL